MGADLEVVGAGGPGSSVRIVRARAARLGWATDVHLNFLGRAALDAFCAELSGSGADAFLITGDIAEAPSLERLLTWVAEALQRPVYFVLGNHDAYRGSLVKMRARARAMTAGSPWLRYLPAVGVVELAEGTALVGHDGWADGRLGNFMRSPVELNDYVLIEELRRKDRRLLLLELRRLGDEAATYMRKVLSVALGRYQRVLVGTHVPPFREACWHEGKISNDDWLPHFTCQAVGEALEEAAKAYPDRRIEVMCGHTHGEGMAEIRGNLVVRTGGAEYGEPVLQGVMEIG
jgi:predicted phosphohydrolase